MIRHALDTPTWRIQSALGSRLYLVVVSVAAWMALI